MSLPQPTVPPGAPIARARATARWGAAAVLASLVLGGLLALPRAWGTSYLRGDSPYYFVTAVSLLDDGDLDLSNQLPHGAAAHGGQISLDRRERIVPKHPILLSLLALPLIAWFGMAGALAFNILQAAVLVWLLYRLGLHVASPASAAGAAVLTAVASFWPHYLWNFSPDLLATLLVVGGVLALLEARNRPPWALLAGALFGAAIWAKLTMGIPVGIALLLGTSPPRRRLAWCLAGLAIPLAVLAALDVHLFGSPFVTSYDRIATLDGGVWRLESTRSAFTLPWLEGARGLLLDRQHGLLWTSPVTLVSLLFVPNLWRRHRLLAILAAASGCGLFLLFASYRFWDHSHYGNRFLFLPVMLAGLALAAALEDLRSRLGR